MTGAGSGCAGGAANSAEAIVSTFRLGHVTMSPVLIISYEVLWGVRRRLEYGNEMGQGENVGD
jgi:hypothetical protein